MPKINSEYDIGAAFEAVENELIASMIRNMRRHKIEEIDVYKRQINELVDEILSIYCLEKQQRKMAIAEENEILSEEAKKAGWKSGVMNI